MGFLDRFRKASAQIPTLSADAESWRSVYKSLIDRYSFLGGAHMEYAKLTNNQFTPIRPLAVLLKEHWPTFSDDEIQTLLNQWKSAFDGVNNTVSSRIS